MRGNASRSGRVVTRGLALPSSVFGVVVIDAMSVAAWEDRSRVRRAPLLGRSTSRASSWPQWTPCLGPTRSWAWSSPPCPQPPASFVPTARLMSRLQDQGRAWGADAVIGIRLSQLTLPGTSRLFRAGWFGRIEHRETLVGAVAIGTAVRQLLAEETDEVGVIVAGSKREECPWQGSSRAFAPTNIGLLLFPDGRLVWRRWRPVLYFAIGSWPCSSSEGWLIPSSRRTNQRNPTKQFRRSG